MLGAMSAATIATSAVAADLPTIVTPPPPMASPAFNWTGPYFGVAGMVALGLPFLVVGVNAGWNAERGRLVYGGEVSGLVQLQGPVFAASADAKIGFRVGDRMMLYATGGVAWGGAFAVTYGGGFALGLGDALSLFGEIGQWNYPGMGATPPIVSAGINFHPRNR